MGTTRASSPGTDQRMCWVSESAALFALETLCRGSCDISWLCDVMGGQRSRSLSEARKYIIRLIIYIFLFFSVLFENQYQPTAILK